MLTEAQAVADWCLCQQDWPFGLAPDFLGNAAEPDPAGVHRVHDVAGSNICVNNPECNSIERYLRWEREERKVLISSTWIEFEFRDRTLHTPTPHLHTGTMAGHTELLLHQHLHMQDTQHTRATPATWQKPGFQTS